MSIRFLQRDPDALRGATVFVEGELDEGAAWGFVPDARAYTGEHMCSGTASLELHLQKSAMTVQKVI